MTKHDFLLSLQDSLSGLPREEAEEQIHFFSEMIDDRMEEGLSEEDAVTAVGSVEDIRLHIMDGLALPKARKIKTSGRRKLRPLEIILLILGSPLWLSLLIAVFAVVLAVYISLWAVVISLWAVFASLLAYGIGVIAGGAVIAVEGRSLEAIALIGTGLVSFGLSVYMFYVCKYATKGLIGLTKWIFRCIKNTFHKEEASK